MVATPQSGLMCCTTMAAIAAGNVRRHHGLETGVSAASSTPSTRMFPLVHSSSATRASPISRNRRLTSRSNHLAIKRRTGAGVLAGSAVQSTSWPNTAARVSGTLSPLNARRPDSIS